MSNLITRTVPVILVLALFLTCLVSPAAATSFDPDYDLGLNVLDYSVSDDGDNSKSTGEDATAQFIYNLPYKSVYRYIDILVSASDGTISEVYAGRTGYATDTSGKSKLTVLSFNGGRMYRIYGSIPARNYGDFEINFKASKSSCVINILSIRLRNTTVGVSNEIGKFSIADSEDYTYTQSSYGDIISHTIGYSSSGDAQYSTFATVSCPNWKNYDFIEFVGGFQTSSVSSVIASCNALSIPYELTYLGSPVSDTLDSSLAIRWFHIVLDLRDIDRSTSAIPIAQFTFTYPQSQGCNFFIKFVHGIVNESNIDPNLYFLRKILDTLEVGFFSVVSAVESAQSDIVEAIEGITIEVDSIDYSSLLLNIQGSLMGINTNLNGWFEDLIETSSGNNLILGNLYRDLPQLFDIIQNALADIDDQLIVQFDEFEVVFKSQITALKNDVSAKILAFQTEFTTQMDGLRSQLTTLSGNLKTWFTNLQTSVTNSISAFQQEFVDQIDDLEETLFLKLDNIRGEILVFKGTFESWMDSLQGLLYDAFGLGDNYIEDANQTQEEVNVSINNQLVGAVEDWNTNIEVVETGYGLAVTQATPALVWLGSLADRIFVNMGWFASIYFLIGLVSVLMLILSKSGLARSVGAASRRK